MGPTSSIPVVTQIPQSALDDLRSDLLVSQGSQGIGLPFTQRGSLSILGHSGEWDNVGQTSTRLDLGLILAVGAQGNQRYSCPTGIQGFQAKPGISLEELYESYQELLLKVEDLTLKIDELLEEKENK